MCSVNGITVSVDFDRPFGGKIYSLDYANIHECIYYNAQEMKNILFTIPMHRCGTRITRNTREVVDTIENRVYVQMEKYTQTVFDRQYSFLCELIRSKAVMGIDGKTPIEPHEIRRHPTSQLPKPLPALQNPLPALQNPLPALQNPLPALQNPIQPTNFFGKKTPIRNSGNNFFPSLENLKPISPVNTVDPNSSSRHLIPVKTDFEGSANKQESINPLPSTSFTTKITDTLTKPITVENESINSVIEDSRHVVNLLSGESPSEPVRIYATQKLNKTEILNDIVLEIQKGDGPGAPLVKEPVKIGDTLTLVIKSLNAPKDRNQYNMFVHSCVATDGPGTTKIDLIDKSGCTISSQILGSMKRERDENTVTYFFKVAAFKFPGPDDVYFSCLVDVSPNYNFPELCNQKSKKSKRELITAKIDSYPIFRDIKVNLKDEPKFEALNSDDNFLCLQYTSTLILGSIIVILTFGCCLSVGTVVLLISRLKRLNKHCG